MPNSEPVTDETYDVDNAAQTLAITPSGTTINASPFTFTFEFSEPVVGGGMAANYQLRGVGPDALLGTADDMILPLSVSYAGTTATLGFPACPKASTA